MAQSVLVIAPHPDDESIGCGGAIRLHHQRGDHVHVLVLTSGERGLPELPAGLARSMREAEAQKAAEVLGVDRIDFFRLPDFGLLRSVGSGAHWLREVMKARMPGIVYLPHPEESHIDHMAAAPIVRSALSRIGSRTETPILRTYEVWTPLTLYNTVEDISAVMEQKLRAIRCHQSQLRSFQHDEAAQGLARYRGVMTANGRYAEVFWDLAPRAFHEWLRRSMLSWKTPSRLLRLRRAVWRFRERRWTAVAAQVGTVETNQAPGTATRGQGRKFDD